MIDKNNLLEEIREQLYCSEGSTVSLMEVLRSSKEIQAWYRASRKTVERNSGFREVNWFLTEYYLIRQEINPIEIFYVSFNLKEIVRIERYFDSEITREDHSILRRAVINFTDGKACDLSRPSEEKKGNAQGFTNLVSLLG